VDIIKTMWEFLWEVLIGEPLLMLCIIISAVIFVLIVIFEHKREQEREQRLRKSGIFVVDNMTGEVFEKYLKSILKARGYKVRLTPATGDYGADLILSTDNTTIVVQAKRYKKKVGLKAVQEIVSAKSHYGADECWVITNNYYTTPAVKLGASNGVILIDRDQLIEWMIEDNQGA
jgi:restriction system protein